jgi:tRNA(Ile)-lysidine synthase
MRPHDPPWGRPLLGITRAQTEQACAELGVQPWQDPHNADPRFTRVRLRREVLPLLEDVLSGGVAPALARTAAQLREDTEALDTLAARVHVRAKRDRELDTAVLAVEPAALRRRVLRRWLLESGVRELTDAHLRSVDALLARWRGQGGVWLPGNLEARRSRGRLSLAGPEPEPTTRGE